MNTRWSWFDEPSWKEPGGSPYTHAPSLAEASKEDKKKEDKKDDSKEEPDLESELMEIIMVLDTEDLAKWLDDDACLDHLLKEFPMLGSADKLIDKVIRNYTNPYVKHTALSTEPDEGIGQFVAPTSTPDFEEGQSSIKEPKVDEAKAKEIGEKIGIKWDEAKFSPKDLMQGIEVELEHGTVDQETNITNDNLEQTAKIAWAHLKENPKYYILLAKMESGSTMNESASITKQSAAYLTLCPNCKSIQRADYWKDRPCENCKAPIPGYFWAHLPEEMEKGGPREKVPAEFVDKVQQVVASTK
jgi:hypothetical protein